jgi:hypothetical protein
MDIMEVPVVDKTQSPDDCRAAKIRISGGTEGRFEETSIKSSY